MTDEVTPRPDPTTLTTAQLYREIAMLREMLDVRVEQTELRFGLVEQRRVEQKADMKLAVDAAMDAAARASEKAETVMSEGLKQLGVQFSAKHQSLDQQVSDVKERISRVESLKQGGQQAYSGIIAVVGFVVSTLIVIDLVLNLASR